MEPVVAAVIKHGRARPERHAADDGIRTPARTVRAPGTPLAGRSGHRNPGVTTVHSSELRSGIKSRLVSDQRMPRRV